VSDHPRWDVKQVLHRLVDVGVRKVSYSGGEPFLHPALGQAVREAAGMGIDQIVTTNGDCLIDRVPSWLGALQYVKLSFYGSAATHDGIMGPGHYGELLLLARRLKRLGIAVGANFMLSQVSLPGIAEFLADVTAASICHILMLTYVPTGVAAIDSGLPLAPPDEGIREAIRLARPHANEFPGGVKIHNYGAGSFTLALDVDARFVVPGTPRTSCFVMGGLDSPELKVPSGDLLPAALALETIWRRRRRTKAIIVV
jgi:MoaA/NifB/PqqE/SkfB family radical SAM enzyme